MNEITKIYKDKQVRIVEKDNDAWFVAKDVAEALGYTTTDHMMRRLDDDEQETIDFPKMGKSNPNGARKVTVINESGLYNAIIGSHKKEAKDFKRWITHDVLPSIRRTGSYSVQSNSAHINGANMQRLLDIMQNFSEIAHENARLAERNCYLSQFEPRSEYGDPNNDGVPCFQKRRGYFVSRKGADVVKKNPEKETFEQLDLFYDRLPGILLETFRRTLNQLSEGK